MFENLKNIFKKFSKKEEKEVANSKDAAKERLHLVLMQDRANVSADFLELMKQEIIEVIKKYIDVDEEAIDVRLTNKENEDGTNGAPALYANIHILNIKNEARKVDSKSKQKDDEIHKAETSHKEKKESEQEKEDTHAVSKQDIKDIEDKTEHRQGKKEVSEKNTDEKREDNNFIDEEEKTKLKKTTSEKSKDKIKSEN